MEFYEDSLRDVFGETLVHLGQQNDAIMVLDADLNTSINTCLFKEAFPNRFIQCGIAEANMFSIAAGMAYMGYTPFPTTFAAFVTRKALDPLFMNICCQKLNVKIAGSYPGLTATECGASHNTCDDIAAIRALPHIRVADVGDNRELMSLMETCVEQDGPVYFRVARANVPVLFDNSHRFAWGKGHELLAGRDVTILSTGMMTGLALKAAQLLQQEGKSAQVIHMPSIKPLDHELIVRAAKGTGAVLTIENGRVWGGFGGAVAELLVQEYPVVMDIMGIGDEPAACGSLGELLVHHNLTPADIALHAIGLIARK